MAPVAIAAAGVVTPIGQDIDTFWSSLLTGTSGISQIERFPVGDLRVGRGGEIKKLSRIKSWGRVPECRATRLLVSAADEVAAQSGLRARGLDPTRLAVVVGTALGGVEEGEKALAGDRRRRRLRDALYDSPAHNLARWLGAKGPVITVSTACASGATAMALGADLLRSDEADAVVAGGYDVLCRFVMRGFDALRSLTRDVVRPFDRRRSGLLLGEGAALVLLLREPDVSGSRARQAPRLRQRERRVAHRRAGSRGPRAGARDPRGPRPGRRRAGRRRLRQRPRDGHPAQRPHRDGGAQAGARPRGPARSP